MARPIPLDDDAMSLTFAGGQLYVADPSGVYVVEEDGPRPLYRPHDVTGLCLAATLDQERLLVADGVYVFQVDRRSGEVRSRWRSSGEGAMTICPALDGSHILVVGCDEGGTVKRFELGRARARATRGGVRYGQLAWVDDKLLCVHSEWSTYITRLAPDLSDDHVLGTVDHGCGGVVAHEGALLVGMERGVARVELAEPPVSSVAWDGPEVADLAWADDGRLVLGTVAGVRVLRLGGEAQSLGEGAVSAVATHGTQVAWIARGPDGRDHAWVDTLPPSEGSSAPRGC